MTALLEARGLAKRFALPGTWPLARRQFLHAVDGVDLAIAPGEAVGLVGESGCGKSTLARLVSRLLDPTAGDLLLDGVCISDQPAARFARSPARRAIQMVFQDPTDSLCPRFSVFDLIADPLRMLDPPAESARLHAKVEAAARAVNLPPELLGRLPHQLSGGQKARVGIARAVVVEPKLLVLDEPTAALDVSVQATVLHLLDRLRRERGIALFFVSHDLNVVRLLCSRILVMHQGQVVESGPAAEVCDRPAHPCTQALISAIPGPRHRPQRIVLEGEPQSPVGPSPTRCRLAGRCPIEQPVCTRAAPGLRPVSATRAARCHLADLS